jgi:hypothetical protein
VGGPAYRFFAGNLAEIKQLRAETAGAALDVGDHDFVPMVQPHFRKWIPIHGMQEIDPAINCCSTVRRRLSFFMF